VFYCEAWLKYEETLTKCVAGFVRNY